MTCIFENFEFVGVFPGFSHKNMKNAYDTWFRGKKMRRFRIWPLFLRIFNLWGSFLGIELIKCALKTPIFYKILFIFLFLMFFTKKTCIICIFHILVTLPRKDPHKLKILKNNAHIRNLLIFLPRIHVLCAFCIYLSIKSGKTQQKFKIPWQTSQIRILRIFLPRSHISHVFLTYLSLKFEKVDKTPQVRNSIKD